MRSRRRGTQPVRHHDRVRAGAADGSWRSLSRCVSCDHRARGRAVWRPRSRSGLRRSSQAWRAATSTRSRKSTTPSSGAFTISRSAPAVTPRGPRTSRSTSCAMRAARRRTTGPTAQVSRHRCWWSAAAARSIGCGTATSPSRAKGPGPPRRRSARSRAAW